MGKIKKSVDNVKREAAEVAKKIIKPVYKNAKNTLKPAKKMANAINDTVKDNIKYSVKSDYRVLDTDCKVHIYQEDTIRFIKKWKEYDSNISIVCETNDRLKPNDHSKLHYMIHEYAGEKLEKECDIYFMEPVSSAIYTGSYDLNKYGVKGIIHVISPRYSNENNREYYAKKIRECCMNVLNLAKSRGIDKIVFPHIHSNKRYTEGDHEEFEVKNIIRGIREWCIYNSTYDIDIYICAAHYDRKKKYDRCSYFFNDVAGECAIVFSGGGAKGAFQVGVWKELEKKGISNRISGYSGTSIGAINTLLLISPLSINEKERFWLEYKKLGLFQDSKQEYMKAKISKLLSAWNEADYKDMVLHHHIYSTICKLGGGDKYIYWGNYCKDKWKDKLNKLVRESAAHPGLYLPVMSGGKLVIDGGAPIKDRKMAGFMGKDNPNVPIQPLYDLGYRKIIVVYLEPEEKNYETIKAENDRYRGTKFYRIFPTENLGDLKDISSDTIKKRIKLGQKAVRIAWNNGIFDDLMD